MAATQPLKQTLAGKLLAQLAMFANQLSVSLYPQRGPKVWDTQGLQEHHVLHRTVLLWILKRLGYRGHWVKLL